MVDLQDAVWVKAKRSSAEGENCVEVATNLPQVVAVRDSKQAPTSPAALVFTNDEWRRFTRTIKASVVHGL